MQHRRPEGKLGPRQLGVVRYLPSNLKVPEIAAELFVSANSIRTHLRHIYATLDVHNRREAVDRARALRPARTAGVPHSLRAVTDVLFGLDAAERERVAALGAEGRFFWLDVSLSETSRDDLVDALGIPERALAALRRTSDGYASRAFHADGESVVFALRCYVESEPGDDGAGYRLRPIEVQVLVTSDYLLTLHDERVALPAVLAPDLPQQRSKRYVAYSVLDAMLATTSDALDEVELRLDALVAAWTQRDGGGVPRATLRQAGARLATMRRWVRNEQVVFERVGLEIGALRDFGATEEPYLDRLDEQVDRLLTSIDAAANALGMVLDLQLNERAYVVSVVATIFVPLTFITGFFGMNFGWMVDRIDSRVAFWLLGFIVPIAAAALSWRLLVRRFLTSDDQ